MSREGGADRLGTLVARAREGDRAALEGVVRAVQDDVYGLALRMLWHPEDAEDGEEIQTAFRPRSVRCVEGGGGSSTVAKGG